ncbi:MAG: aminotransferase class IV [Desulfobacterales bacterium]|nr:MAG: aminotransferase class IV [Desulfobacterales bacterium]
MNHEAKVWLNGNLIPWREATVPLLSHGFSRGSAIFEVLGTHVGPQGTMAFRMDAHLSRLMKSAELLGMKLDFSAAALAEAIQTIVRENKLGRGLVKILAYWGEEAIIRLVLDAPLDVAIFTIAESPELGLDDAKPISACVSKWRKIHPETVPVAAKACANYLNGYLARKDAASRGFNVGLMLGTDGFLAEGSIESAFIVKDGILKTPPAGRILSSITRMSILQAAPQSGIPVMEYPISADELYAADEMFTAHTGIKVSPINRFENREMPAPGPVTRRVMELMENILHFKDDRFKDWFQPLS